MWNLHYFNKQKALFYNEFEVYIWTKNDLNKYCIDYRTFDYHDV
jgi:hypothetical protein